jgi:hypothetical protein
MINRFALIVVATACCAMPAVAEEIGVGVGPVGVTVGSGPDRVVREREVSDPASPRKIFKILANNATVRPSMDRVFLHLSGNPARLRPISAPCVSPVSLFSRAPPVNFQNLRTSPATPVPTPIRGA